MSRPVKVCFVSLPARGAFAPSAGARIGGAEVQVQRLSTYLAAQDGFEAHVIVEDCGQPAREVIGGVTLWRLKQPPERASSLGRAWRAIGSAISLWRQIRALRPDVCLQASAGAETGIAQHAAHSVGAAFVYRLSSDSECAPPWSAGGGLRARLFRRGLAHADAVIAQHERQRQAIRQALGREAIVVPSVFEFPPYRPAGGDRVLWAGRCGAPKGPERFLDLARRIPEARCLMVAPPADRERPLFERVQRAAATVGNLEFVPGVSPDAMKTQLRRAALLVNTSDYEGMPNTFLEAAGHGVAIVSLNADPDGLLTRERAGRWAGGDSDGLVAIVRELLADGATREAQARRGYEVFSARHDLTSVGPAFSALLKKTIARGTEKSAAPA